MFTIPELLNKWWTTQSEGQAQVNEEFRFYFSEDYDWRARVLEVSENESISYQMLEADDDWKHTILSFELSSTDHNHHLLRFEHRNWKQVNAHFRRTSYCWALYLNDLKKYVEQKFNKEIKA